MGYEAHEFSIIKFITHAEFCLCLLLGVTGWHFLPTLLTSLKLFYDGRKSP